MIPTGNLITLCCPLNSGKCTIQFSIDNEKQSATDDSSYSVHQDIHTSGKLLRRSLCCQHQVVHNDMLVHLSLFVLAKYRVGSAKMEMERNSVKGKDTPNQDQYVFAC